MGKSVAYALDARCNNKGGSMKISLLVLLALLTLPANNYAASEKEDYELQEWCGTHAAEVSKRENGNGISQGRDGTITSNYAHHYNRKLNKCFILFTSTFTPRDSKKLSASTDKSLRDINENKTYGSFLKFENDTKPFQCEFLDKYCSSEDEWDGLAKPYMEE
jgi:hypothetical protein